MISLGWPQVTYLALSLLGLGVAMAKHGESKGERYNFVTTSISTVIVIWILYCGGFFG